MSAPRLLALLFVVAAGATAVVLIGVPLLNNPPWATEDSVEPAPPPPELDHPWPPVLGERYPDMALHDLDGNVVRLSSFAGKVLVICPIGTTSPGSIGFEGGPDCEPLAGFAPQKNVLGLPQLLTRHGVPPDHEDLVTVHLLLYSSMQDPPTPEQARQWMAHFDLDRRSNAVVLVGDRRYTRPETLRMIPGFQVVDQDFVLRADGGGVRAPDNIYDVVFPRVALELGVEDPTVEGTLADLNSDHLPPTRPGHPAAAMLFELLDDRDHAALERELARLHAAGRAPGSHADQLSLAVDNLLAFPDARALVEGWHDAAPDSAFACLVRGEDLIDFAWEARGGGYADTVSDDGWRLFRKRLSQARAAFEHAAELDPDLAHAHAGLITVGMGESRELAEIFDSFKAAVRIDPSCMKAYQRMVTPMLPRWFGDEEVLFDFVRRAAAKRPEDPAMQMLLVTAHTDVFTGDERRAYLSRRSVVAELERAFDALEQAFPESGSVWHRRARVARYQDDTEEWLRCTQRAAEAGSIDAKTDLARCYETGKKGVEKDLTRAFELYCEAAHDGEAKSYGDVGRMFCYGRGVRRNSEATFAWASRGAGFEDPQSMHLLGILHWSGAGTEQNLETAYGWLRKSARAGDSRAIKAMEKFLAQHPELERGR